MLQAQDARPQEEPLALLISRYWFAERIAQATREFAAQETKIQYSKPQSQRPRERDGRAAAGIIRPNLSSAPME